MKSPGGNLVGGIANERSDALRLIAAAIEKNRLSQRRLAGVLGLKSHGSLSRFIAGRQSLPFEVLEKLCARLGIEGAQFGSVVSALYPNIAAALKAPDYLAPTVKKQPVGAAEIKGYFSDSKVPIKSTDCARSSQAIWSVHDCRICYALSSISRTYSRENETGSASASRSWIRKRETRR
jgi:transcriptional regulator with XRE-family HTH domain